MKINPDMIIGSVAGNQSRPQGTARGGFEDVLKGLESETPNAPGKVGSPFQMTPVSSVKLSAVSAGEEALELLESYSLALADPNLNLKAISPMVDRLEAMKNKVDNASSFIADNDPLKGIMNEVSSTLYGEVLRFRRGELIG